MLALHQVTDLGQSLWLNYMRRALIERGEMRHLLEAGVRGVTMDVSVVEKAVSCSADYDQLLPRILASDVPVQEAHEALLIDDAQRTADALHTLFVESGRRDGFVSFPLNLQLAHNAVSIVAEGTRLAGVCAAANRPNIMIQVPATPAGIRATETLIADGCDVHVTHIFSLALYEAVVAAYLAGLERFFESHSVWRTAPAAVAAVPRGPLDREVDGALHQLGRSDLAGKAGIALAKVMYARFREIFDGKRWRRLEREGALPQRLLWMDTMPTDFAFPDTYYADALIGPDTVHAMVPATLYAFRDHGTVAPTLATGVAEARAHLEALQDVGIDLERNAQKPQERSVTAATKAFQRLVSSVIKKREDLDLRWQRLEMAFGPYERQVRKGLDDMCAQRVMCRIWERDATVWDGAGDGISRRLDWMSLPELMAANVDRLQEMVQTTRAAGYSDAVVFSSGTPLMVANLFRQTFGQLPYIPGVVPYAAKPHLKLSLVDVNEQHVLGRLAAADASQNSLYLFCADGEGPAWQEAVATIDRTLADVDGLSQHVIIAAPATHALQGLADRYPLAASFRDAPALSGPFTALAYAGLLPAAFTGLDVATLLDRAARMACNASGCNCPVEGDNVAAQVGTALGVLAAAGRSRLTFVTSDFLASVAQWAGQALAETVAGRIAPVVGEPVLAPEQYGDNRCFMYLRLDGDTTHDAAVNALRGAGYPVLTLHIKELYELGGFLFMWQMAMVVAAHHLGVSPFGVQEHKAPAPTRRERAIA